MKQFLSIPNRFKNLISKQNNGGNFNYVCCLYFCVHSMLGRVD